MAIRSIDKGTELTLCYLGEKDRFSDVDKRRMVLKKYGFDCNCEVCKKGFFGEARNGGVCYHQCQSKSIIMDEQSGYLGKCHVLTVSICR